MIRPATPADLDAMAHIEAVGMKGGWSRKQIAEELANPRARVLVFEQHGAVRGHAIGWEIAGEAQVLEVCVHPDARRQGMGRALVAALMVACGGGEALLELRASNAPALALYEALGFKQVGRRPRYYADGEDALLMTREGEAPQ